MLGYSIEGHKHLLTILLSVLFTLKFTKHITQLIIVWVLNNTIWEH